MDSMKAIYKILERLDKALDESESDFSDISHEALGISLTRWNNLFVIMQEARLITGIKIYNGGQQRGPCMIDIDNACITILGMQYLADNSTAAKIFRAAKEIKDLIPGL